MSIYSRGDKVRKIKGYPFAGTVSSVYPHEDKCVVRHKDGWDHIFHDNQLLPDLPEYQYLDLLRELHDKACDANLRGDRTGVGTYSVFGRQIRFDLTQGFPLLTTKRLPFKSIAAELVWFLRGCTNVDFLHERGCTIWDEWADENGELGPVYGKQWRDWGGYQGLSGRVGGGVSPGIDQLADVIAQIRANPGSRRHIVTAWNPADVPNMALPPCHMIYQFYVDNCKLSCHLYMRSADIFLGVPFNIASYALLTHVIAREVGLGVGELIQTFGDVHLYSNHVEQAEAQLRRTPLSPPALEWGSTRSWEHLDVDDFVLLDYHPHTAIKAAVAV